MINKELADLAKEATEKGLRAFFEKKDDLSLILTAHLYIEYWIEVFIRHLLPKPEKILGSVNLSFLEKLALAESLGFDRNEKFGLTRATKQLNTIRNKIAHKLEFRVSGEDLKLMSTLKWEEGMQKSMEKTKSLREELIMFCITVQGYVMGFVDGRIKRENRKKAVKND